MNRKVIVKIKFGSHLYGTNRPESDEDYLGVFIPSTEDVFGMEGCPKEWTLNEKHSVGTKNEKGDVDYKLYSLSRYFEMLSEGQSAALEILFAPDDLIIEQSPEWAEIKNHKHLFLSKLAITPFVNFASAQAHKSEIKGENLNKIRKILSLKQGLQNQGVINRPISFFLSEPGNGTVTLKFENELINFPYSVFENEKRINKHIHIAGFKYDIGMAIKRLMTSLEEMESKYGQRSELAATEGVDWKSLMNAYRLIGQAEEFLTTGNLTFPRPDREFLRSILRKEFRVDYRADISEKTFALRAIQAKSPLPDGPSHSKIRELYLKLMMEYFKVR